MAASFDVERARAETPGVGGGAHLDAAGAALPPRTVTEAVVAHLRAESELGGYRAAAEAADALERPYASAATLLGCAPDEVAIVDSATRAWQLALSSVPLGPGDEVLTTEAEYGSNWLGLLHDSQRRGYEVRVVPDVGGLADAADDRLKLVCLTHVPAHTGVVNGAAAAGGVARSRGARFLLDATQSLGQVPVHVGSIGCDLLCGTGRKFLRAPRGTGLLYVSSAVLGRLEPPFVDVRSASFTGHASYALADGARRFESWESSRAAVVGLGVALDYAQEWGLDAISDRVRSLADGLRTRLKAIPGVSLVGATGTSSTAQGAIVGFRVRGVGADVVRLRLGAAGVHVWVIAPSSSPLLIDEPLVRASVHYYNDARDLDRCVRAVGDVAAV